MQRKSPGAEEVPGREVGQIVNRSVTNDAENFNMTRSSTSRRKLPQPLTAMEAYKALQKVLRATTISDEDEYETKQHPVSDYLAPEVNSLLFDAIRLAISEVQKTTIIDCISKVPDKSYFAFKHEESGRISRPVNVALYSNDIIPVHAFFDTLEKEKTTQEISKAFALWDTNDLQKTLYSMVMAFCCARDMQANGDQKTPGTFFEYFIGYVFSKRLQVNPVRRVDIHLQNQKIPLTTDFLFDPGQNRKKLHVPVKTSTRERVIQVWAHQKVLDGTQGAGHYLGTPVLLTETKLDKEKLEVIEICLPDQWRIYQGYISQLTRVYYLDMPKPYSNLNSAPLFKIHVRPFSEFFVEADELTLP